LSQIDGLEANTNHLARLGADRVNDDMCPEARAIFPNSPTFGFENTFALRCFQRALRATEEVGSGLLEITTAYNVSNCPAHEPTPMDWGKRGVVG
jgi:hypothetical protein